MNIEIKDFRVGEGDKVDLDKWPTKVDSVYKSKGQYKKLLKDHVAQLSAQQRLHYASNRHAILLIFQAMDAGGKDGAIRHVMSGVNPQGCQVFSFKHPSGIELEHDFLWRTTRDLPERGRIGIFNRSYYEEVLILRVHPELLRGEALVDPPGSDKAFWHHRYRSITNLERHLHANGTRVVKFFLHLSKEEQRKRFLSRIDTAETVRIVSEEAAKESYDLRSIHIPKTIDNDVMENDHAPGYPSAARFVAQAFMGADLDNRSLPGVYVAVVMGRTAGFLTAASSAARTVEGDGPHLIYLPERNFDKSKFLSEVKSVHNRLGRCVIALSEGIRDTDGTPLTVKLAQTVEKDAHGNVQLSGTGALADLLCEEIKSKLGIKRVRGDTFGYLQRSFAGCASDVDRREARELGEFAVKQAIWGKGDGSVAIRRIGHYAVDYALVKLAKVAGKTKVVADAFIAPSGSDVTPAFQEYLRPLLGSDLPQPARLRGGTIAKVLKR